MRRHGDLLGILALAVLLRVVPIRAGLPYLGYVDEGHVLHPVITLLAKGGWDPGTYLHPSLTACLITGLARLARPAYVLVHGHSLYADLPASGTYYDFVSPVEIIVLGRLLIAAFSVATVLLVFVLAERLGGRPAAVLAGLFAALCPALVTRASIVIIDSISTFFALAALYFAHRLEKPEDGLAESHKKPFLPGSLRDSLLAGASAGLAFVAKYTIGVVFLAVAFTVLTRPTRLGERIRLLILAAGAAILAALIAMPALVFRFQDVVAAIEEQARLYSNPSLFTSPSGGPGYLGQALQPLELGIPLMAAIAFGLGWMLLRPSTRRTALAWALFAGALLVPLLLHEYQPFRNILPLVPPLVIAASLALAEGPSLKGRRAWLKVLPAIVVVGSLAVAVARWLPAKVRLVDSRIVLVNWLVAKTSRDQRILLLEELAVFPSEVEKIPAIVRVVPWLKALDALRTERFDYLVIGRIDLTGSARPEWAAYLERWNNSLAVMTIIASTGGAPTSAFPNLWRYNDEIITVLEVPATAPPSPDPPRHRPAGRPSTRPRRSSS